MELQDLKELIKNFEDGSIRDLVIDDGDFHLKLSKNESAELSNEHVAKEISFTNTNVASMEQPPLEASTDDEQATLIKAPLVGSVYLQANEGARPYVEVGANVKKGQTVAIIEAMKMLTEIKSPVAGKVTEILVSNEEIVEFDTPLFKIITA
ncbi:acetyl-CoA carboxylase biotin carboxyl carrier protein [Periweissella beninensis]|uniref:acetyl-CoA carboxylase biotin carboxyl carrier protein n=1 Tax=Periweissella beninensis TaxID=504936 RepID=UPI0021A2FB66|nr:acetyl-CoA carboxylase biotin carboxyl carrier protein [Periweissella beninensis]MCT4396222.1 acetyl-CoA carboxylase biotin carboxyl carrier protein [Periweissella beninensis]